MSDHSFASPRRQLFSVPADVISYILNNPSSSKALMKLYQTCKYFYSKLSILIADDVTFSTDKNKQPYTKIWLNSVYKSFYHLQTPLWLSKELIFSDYFFDQHPPLQPQIFRCSVESVVLYNTVLKFEDFVFLTAENTIKEFAYFGTTDIYHPDKASINEILQRLPNVQRLTCFIDETCSAEMLMNLCQTKLNNKLQFLWMEIRSIHSEFDMNIFCKFIMAITTADTQLFFDFHVSVKEKLKVALEKLDPMWKNKANDGLRDLFTTVDPNWDNE